MPDAREVVSALLKRMPGIRITAEKALRHRWLLQNKDRISKSKLVRVLTNVVRNTAENTFKKFALRVIAEEMSVEKIDVCRSAFCFIDRNNDGNVDVEELRRALAAAGHEDDAREVFDAIDVDMSGSLNLAEFVAASIGPQEYCNKEVLWRTFKRFDRDGNGSFDVDEIKSVCQEIESLADTSISAAQVKAMQQEVNMPCDFETFVQIMLTPPGTKVCSLWVEADKFMHSTLGIDMHGVRHIDGTIDPRLNLKKASAYSSTSPLRRSVGPGEL
eukprot:NODE_1855_length_1047_cov_362.367944.p1 GENE.NODE_1855_length_1047_cov_362.367944~~NODE_1855_length_1047_cov_362.367944.p1  ORF type:complete len:301 (+),score=92.61 NODE_1855_length_1047_cov_362.367944:86-904(+)